MKYYVLRTVDYYLSDIEKDSELNLINFTLDKNLRKLYSDYDSAYNDYVLLYIEIGIVLRIEEFGLKGEENE